MSGIGVSDGADMTNKTKVQSMKSKPHSTLARSAAFATLAAMGALMFSFCQPTGADTFDWIQAESTDPAWDWEDSNNWTKLSGDGAHTYPQFAGDVAIFTNGVVVEDYYEQNTTLQISGPVTVGEFRCRSRFSLNKAPEASDDARLILDNLGKTARFANDNELGGGGKNINVPVEIIGEAHIGNASHWDNHLVFNNGLIGGADSVVRFKKETTSGSGVTLWNNQNFFGTIYNHTGDDDFRGLYLNNADAFGSVKKIFNARNIIITYPAADADVNGRLEHILGGSMMLLDSGSLANALNPTQFVPRKGVLRFAGGMSDKWPDDAPMVLRDTELRVISNCAMIGGLTAAGAGVLATDYWTDTPNFTLGIRTIGVERGGTLILSTFSTNLFVGAQGDLLDDAVPPRMRSTLGNGVEMLHPRVMFIDVPAKINGTEAPFAIAKFEAADFTPFDIAGPDDYALLVPEQTVCISNDMTVGALEIQVDRGLETAEGFPVPTLTLRRGIIGGRFQATVSVNLVFGESTADRSDAVIHLRNSGGQTQYYQLRKLWAKDLYVYGSDRGWAGVTFNEWDFDLEGEIFANIVNGSGMNLANSTGLTNTIANINSLGNGALIVYNTPIGGVRGTGDFRLNSPENIIINAVDSIHEGRVADSDIWSVRALLKRGPAMQTFTGAIESKGGIHIEEGTLRLDGVTPHEQLVFIGADAGGLFPGGTLAGTGTIGTNTILAAGGTIAPAGANETGALTFTGSLAATAGSIAFEIASATEFDKIVVDGDAQIAGAKIDIKLLNDFTPRSSAIFPLIEVSGDFSETILQTRALWPKGFTLHLEGNKLCAQILPQASLLILK